MDFRTAESSNSGKYVGLDTDGKTFTELDAEPTNKEDVMLAALSLKGDIPTLTQIKEFTINANGEVTLAFDNANVYCMTVSGTTFTAADYTVSTGGTDASGTDKLVAGGTAVCIAK